MSLRSARRGAALFAIITTGIVGCDSPLATAPVQEMAGPNFSHVPTHHVFTSGSHVNTWDAILPATADPNWPTTVCTPVPGIGPNANWQNPHSAFVVGGHPWADLYFSGAPWINAWNFTGSVGPGGHNWTKYQTAVTGNGSYVIKLLADNCSWVYLDGILVGRQPAAHSEANTQYGLVLSGTHTLSFIIFDGGGAAGGKFILETTTTPPPALNPDLDGDGYPNTDDAFPLNPQEWADSDGDGVGDNADAHDNSDTRGLLFIGTCNTGVANRHMGGGTYASDLVADAYASAANHGAFVSAVSDLSNSWKKAGKITGREHGAIVSCAARTK